MYPLNVVLIGCGPEIHSAARRGFEMNRAVMEAEFPDVATALRKLTPTNAKAILFAVKLQSEQDLADLRPLVAAYPDQPILGLRSGAAAPAFFNAALRAGAAFVVSLPSTGDDLTMALDWIARPYGGQPNRSPLVVVAGVVGGCGATTLAVNLAFEIGRLHGRRSLLVELALRLGVIATNLNLEARQSIHDLLNLGDLDLGLLRQVVTPVNAQIDLLAGPPAGIRTTGVPTADILRVIDYGRALADIVIADLPCTYDDFYFDILAAADYQVIVLEQSVAALRAFRMVRETLQTRQSSGRPSFVVNRYNPRLTRFALEDLQRLQKVAKFWPVANDFAGISAAANHGRPLFQEAPGSPALAGVDDLAAALIGAKAPVQASRSSMFARLVRACRLT